MANISWTSGSINSFFNTSLGNPNYQLGGIYNCLNDAALIKSGSYHKLMDSYHKAMAEQNETETDKKAESTSDKKTDYKTEIEKDTPKRASRKSDYLDNLLAAKTYTNTGEKTQPAASTTVDQSV